jgi:hypothetical protein
MKMRLQESKVINDGDLGLRLDDHLHDDPPNVLVLDHVHHHEPLDLREREPKRLRRF